MVDPGRFAALILDVALAHVGANRNARKLHCGQIGLAPERYQEPVQVQSPQLPGSQAGEVAFQKAVKVSYKLAFRIFYRSDRFPTTYVRWFEFFCAMAPPLHFLKALIKI
jgi:hypothetical protein